MLLVANWPTKPTCSRHLLTWKLRIVCISYPQTKPSETKTCVRSRNPSLARSTAPTALSTNCNRSKCAVLSISRRNIPSWLWSCASLSPPTARIAFSRNNAVQPSSSNLLFHRCLHRRRCLTITAWRRLGKRTGRVNRPDIIAFYMLKSLSCSKNI